MKPLTNSIISATRASLLSNLSCLLMLILLVPSAGIKAQQPDNSIITDTDYSIAIKAHSQNKTDLSQLESISNIEIFYWYGCESCYQVEVALQQYLDLHPEVTVRRTPLIARPSWRKQANLQAIMEQLSGQLPEQAPLLPVTDLYQACLQDCKVFESFERNKVWLADAMQLSEFPILDMNSLWNAEKNYQKRADLFSITQVPTIIINETYKIDANQAKTPARMVKITDHLLSLAAQ